MKKVFVHKFKYSHDKKRKKIKKLKKEGKAKVLKNYYDGCLYEIIGDSKC